MKKTKKIIWILLLIIGLLVIDISNIKVYAIERDESQTEETTQTDETQTEVLQTITFNSNGGTGSMNDVTNLSGTYTLPSNGFIAPNGKQFKGWSLTTNGTIITTVEMNTDRIVYAIWEDIPTVYTYEIISGNNQNFSKGEADSYVIKIDGDYSKFQSFEISGLTLVKDTDYTVTEGSTIITLTATGLDKIETLDEGDYNFTVKYTNNETVVGLLKINATSTDDLNNNTDSNNNTDASNSNTNTTNNPQTSDNIIIYIISLISGIVCLAVGIVYLKIKRKILFANK